MMFNKPFSMAWLRCCMLVVVLNGSAAAQDVAPTLPLPAGTELQRNVKYFSASGDHYLIFQDDGNLVVYDKNAHFVWGVNEITSDYQKAAKAGFNASGVFGLFDAQGKTLWSPGVDPIYAAELALSSGGSLQILSKDKGSRWTSDGSKVEPPSLDLATHLPGTWGDFVISADHITAMDNGKVKWSGTYAITGNDTLAITYDDGHQGTATMRVYERQQGRLLVKRLGWSMNDGGGDTSRRSDQTEIATSAPASDVELTLEGHRDSVTTLAFSPDGKTLASGSRDEYIKLWDVAAGKEIRKFAGPQRSDGIIYVESVAFSPDGKTLASASREGRFKAIKLWDVATGKEIRTLASAEYTQFSVAFSPDGKTLVSAGMGSEYGIKVWDVAEGKQTRTLVKPEDSVHIDLVFSVAYSPDGKAVAGGRYDGSINLWDLAAGEKCHALKGHSNEVWSVAFSPDGKTLASGSYDATIRLWDVAMRKEIRTIAGHPREVNSVAFSPDGKTLASGSSDTTIKLWDVATGKEFRTLTGHSDSVKSVAFSPDGKTLASGSRDGVIKLWRVQ